MIDIQRCSITYDMGHDQLPVISCLTANIQAGESVAIMGQSGSGKSTLLNALGLMLEPTDGSLYIDGVDVGALSASARAQMRNQKIGMVFQDFHLLPHMTAEENVSLPLQYAGRSRAAALNVARDFLAEVGLSDRLHHKPAELSGGQRQRVAIARSLINRPQLILADEPTGALDSKTGRSVLQLLLDLAVIHGMTLIMVTHDPDAAALLSSQLLLTKAERALEPGFKTCLEQV